MLRSQADRPFELVVMVGDNLYGSQQPRDFVDKFAIPYGPLLRMGIPFQAALGNHDEPDSRIYPKFNMNGQRYYSFVRGPARKCPRARWHDYCLEIGGIRPRAIAGAMITEDQSAVVAYLSSPAAHGGAAVELIETHISMVFLAGERAWKLKRAVRYDYLDYSSADRRRTMCEEEVRVNRRTAPALYRGVTAVSRQPDGSLAIGGSGPPVDWLVEMVRFDENGLFDRLAEAGVLPLRLMEPLAHAIARLHQTADCRLYHGGWDAMRAVIDGNAAGFARDGAAILDAARCATLDERARFAVDRVGGLLDRRRDQGLVRQCHGDLHLRNIVLLGGEPVLFDAIEFNDEFSAIDVLYDLAYVLMDLWRLGLPHHANVLWNSYLAETGDLDGVPLMPLLLSCRAAVMAKTTATTAALQTDEGRRRELRAVAADYLAMALALLEPPPPRLVAVGGRSGTGKSTLAMDLAPSVGPAPGAVVIRSDAIRKQLCGARPLDRLRPEGYTDDVSRRVYATLMEHAGTVVRAGHAAIADAVFANASDRDAIQHVASAAGVPFTGLWLEAPEPILISRVDKRGPDVSDADADVIRRQPAQPEESLRWQRLDASRSRAQVRDAAAGIVSGGASQTTM
jgi:aminoglycoside phosphotransferase family enzyme/predicted kinase